MSTQSSFWQRVGAMFRGESAGQSPGNGRRAAAGSNGSHGSLSVADVQVGEPPPETGQPGLMARLGRRDPSVHQMRDGYQRLVGMVDALQEHFHKQDERSTQLADSVGRMVGILEQVADSGRSQQEHIRSIADNVNAAGQHTAAMSEALSQMPHSFELQAEAVRTMLRQIEVSQEADTQLMHSLQQLGSAVDALNSSSTAQVQTLERLNAGEHEQKEALTLLVREQSRRFLVIVIVAGILGIGALAAMAITLAVQLSR